MIKLIKYLFWLIFPERCVSCNKIVDRGQELCEICSEKLEKCKNICLKCGCEKPDCDCKFATYHFRQISAPFNYGGCSSRILYSFKFGNYFRSGRFLGNEMVNIVNKRYSGINFDFITAVPMSRTKKFIKGYNHSEHLAKYISKCCGIPYNNCLLKLRRGKTQHKLKYRERFLNVKNKYGCRDIAGAGNVLLVDDVKTTGATLDECTRQLMFAGAADVCCVTAIVNSRKKENNG